MLYTQNNLTQVTLLPQGALQQVIIQASPREKVFWGPDAILGQHQKHFTHFNNERYHLHQDKAAWFPENDAQQVRVGDKQVIPPWKGKTVLHGKFLCDYWSTPHFGDKDTSDPSEKAGDLSLRRRDGARMWTQLLWSLIQASFPYYHALRITGNRPVWVLGRAG